MLETPEDVVRIVSAALRELEITTGRIEAIQLFPDSSGDVVDPGQIVHQNHPKWLVQFYLPAEPHEVVSPFEFEIATIDHRNLEEVKVAVQQELNRQIFGK